VVETAHGPDAVAVEDRRLAGVERVRFEPAAEGGVRVEVELDYRLKERTPATALVDLLFIRRAQQDALQRTVRRLVAEARLDADVRAGRVP